MYIGDSKPTFPAESDNKQSVSSSTQQQAVRSEQSISVPIPLSRFEDNRIGSSFTAPLRHHGHRRHHRHHRHHRANESLKHHTGHFKRISGDSSEYNYSYSYSDSSHEGFSQDPNVNLSQNTNEEVLQNPSVDLSPSSNQESYITIILPST